MHTRLLFRLVSFGCGEMRLTCRSLRLNNTVRRARARWALATMLAISVTTASVPLLAQPAARNALDLIGRSDPSQTEDEQELLKDLMREEVAGPRTPQPDAGQPGPGPRGSNAPNQRLPVPDYLMLSLEMSEALYDKTPNDENLRSMLTDLEQVLTKGCFRDMSSTLNFAGGSSVAECNRIVAKILRFDPQNPVAICVRDGIDAPACQETSAAQLVTTNPPPYTRSSSSPLLRSKAKGEEESVRPQRAAEWGLALTEFQGQKNAESKYKAVMALRNALAILCKDNRSEYRPWQKSMGPERDEATALDVLGFQEGRARAAVTAAAILIARRDPSDSLGSKIGLPVDLATPTPTPIPLSEKFTRVRYSTVDCAQVVSQAKAEKIVDWSMICHIQGFVSPQCIQARRQARDNPIVAPPVAAQSAPQQRPAPRRAPEGGPGFSTF